MRNPFRRSTPTVSVVRLSGVIAAGPRGLNDQSVAPLLDKAFRKKPKAVALVINSPGGSPVQSSLIGARIRRLAEEKDIPVFAFVEDVAASGGYWIACAADEIFVDQSSIIGSIGVISASFGFQDLIARYGVERRVHTAGESKSFMDPFLAEKPEDVARLKDLQEQIHQAFIDHVRRRRGDKLSSEHKMFGGEIWVGPAALAPGIADDVGHLVPVMKARFGDKTRFAVYGQRRSVLSRLGMALTDGMAQSLEHRALWARYGL